MKSLLWLRLFKLAVLVGVPVLAGVYSYQFTLVQSDEEVPFQSFRAPETSLFNAQVKAISQLELREPITIVNFWATWCGPCRTEMPSMQALYDDYGSRGLELIAINQREPLSMVQDFVDEFGYTFPVLLDGPGVIGFQYGVRSIPLTYLITPDGRIIAGKPGAQDWNTPKVREALEVLLDYYL